MTVSTTETLYYATSAFRVSLLSLLPGQALPSQTADTHGVRLPMADGLQSQANEPVKAGSHIRWSEQSANIRYDNGSPQPIRVLELLWADIPPNQQKPLAEVTENRPWGSFTVLADEPDFKLKQLWVKPGNRLSLQRHQKREEHWFITAGSPTITLNDATLHPSVGDYVHIPLQAWHRLANPSTGTEGVEIIELQLGTYFGEDDIERQSDDYGRQ